MPSKPPSQTVLASIPLLLSCAAPVSAATTYADIAPLLQKHCVICHAGPGAPSGLRLDSYANLRQGSSKGPVATPGDPAGSELVRRIRGQSQPRMPLTGPPFLGDQEIARVEAWIADGMQDAPGGTATAADAAPPRRRPQPGEPVTFADVEPIFLQRCVKCHTQGGVRGGPPEGLELKTREQILRSGERVAVVPGVPAASELVRRIRGQSRPRMPFDGPPYLSDEEIRLIGDWIAQGAKDADGRAAPIPVGARVRLEGRLDGRWRLDGLPLVVGPDTRIRKGAGPGDYVEVRGHIQPDGSVAATRIRRR